MQDAQLQDFVSKISKTRLQNFIPEIEHNMQTHLQERRHGKWFEWENMIATKVPSLAEFQDRNKMHLGKREELSEQQYHDFCDVIDSLIPWRKGPFTFFDLQIETEWRSDWKWDRIKDHIDVKNKMVLDVGCGSGYHCWKIWDAGAKYVIGIDPTQIYYFQFLLTKKLFGFDVPVFFLPIGIEHLPQNTKTFDVVFSMGVLYHRKSPLEHLETLRSHLCKGGTLVLETLIVDGPLHHAFVPEDRYAQMRNVWFLPSPSTLEFWLKKVGFVDVTCVDINQTTIEEQKTTRWMPYQSLSDFLDPTDNNYTIEGHPAPKRAFFVAKCP